MKTADKGPDYIPFILTSIAELVATATHEQRKAWSKQIMTDAKILPYPTSLMMSSMGAAIRHTDESLQVQAAQFEEVLEKEAERRTASGRLGSRTESKGGPALKVVAAE